STLITTLFCLQMYLVHLYLHSFPTRRSSDLEHKMFKDIINYFDKDDVMILNNTKVFPARLFGNKEKTGARIEVFLLRELNEEQRSEEHTSELQSRENLVCRLLLEKKKNITEQ